MAETKFENLAVLQMRLVAGAISPAVLVWLETTFFGKIASYFIKATIMKLNSAGITFLNVGVERISALIDKRNWDGTLESALKLVEEAHGTLTPEKAKEIDDKVIAAFDRFADFRGTSLFDNRNP